MPLNYQYQIQLGQLNGYTNKVVTPNVTYLEKAFGFSDKALDTSTSSWYTAAAPTFVEEYEALFGKTLAITDGYTFFEEGNTNHMDTIFDSANTPSVINYNSSKPVKSRVEVYKDLYLESMVLSTRTDIAGVGTIFGDNAKIAAWIDPSSVNFDPTNTKFDAYKEQLQKEADLLKSELQVNEMSYSGSGLGYASIGYKDNTQEVAVLNQQLDTEMQNLITLYDELFTYYKQKAGSHVYDNGVQAADVAFREREAATAAAMNVSLALEYAESYYSQTIKPTAAEFMFGQAPIAFSDIDTTYSTGRKGWTSDQINNYANRQQLDPYMIGSGLQQTELLFMNRSGIRPQYYTINNTSTTYPSSTTQAAAYKAGFFWNMNDSANEDANQPLVTDSGYDTGTLRISLERDDPGSFLNYTGSPNSETALNEIGDTVDSYISWMVRDSYGAGGITPTIKNKEYCREDATYLSGAIIDVAQRLVDIRMQLTTKAVETAINNRTLGEYEARMGAIQAMNQIRCANGTDPYEINIDGQKYIMGQDKNADGSIDDIAEILGINDSKENIFKSLKNLDTDNDGYVSQEEMQAQNIVLGAVDQSGKFTGNGYDMGLVKGISLASLQNADGTNNVFGKFTMDLQNKSVAGNVTYENSDYFHKLFGWDESNADDIAEDSADDVIALPVSGTVPAFAATSEPATPATTPAEATTTATSETEAETTEETPVTTENDFSFNFTDINDNKSAIEKLFDQLCWKLGISDITATQKYNIIDGIDPNMEIALAEAEMAQDLEEFNFSA